MSTITFIETPVISSIDAYILEELVGLEVALTSDPMVLMLGSKEQPLTGFVFEDPYFFVRAQDLLEVCVTMKKGYAETWLKSFPEGSVIAFASSICRYNEVILKT